MKHGQRLSIECCKEHPANRVMAGITQVTWPTPRKISKCQLWRYARTRTAVYDTPRHDTWVYKQSHPSISL